MASIGLREMAGKIFISYRRGDERAFAGHIGLGPVTSVES